MNVTELKESGFTGFITIRDLQSGQYRLPNTPGVYVVVRTSHEAPEFVEVGTGGHFKDKDPNVSLSVLAENWVEDSEVLYIGKASKSLSTRVGQYMKFGKGQKIGHWGGRYIWQLSDVLDCLLCWKEITNEEPRNVEWSMIQEFVEREGKRPFANLQD